MINSVSDNSGTDNTAPPGHQPEDSDRQENSSGQIAYITNLPEEVLQIIALEINPDAKDYANLRATSRAIHAKLISFEEMAQKIKEGGADENKNLLYKRILADKEVWDLFSQHPVVHSALANFSFELQNYNFYNSGLFVIDVDCWQGLFDSINNALYSFHRESNIPNVSNIFSGLIRQDLQHYVSSSAMDHSRVKAQFVFICKSKDSIFPVNETFAAFQKASAGIRLIKNIILDDKDFFDVKIKKVIVAALATKIRDYWYSNNPPGVNNNDISNSVSRYPDLFATGERALRMISANP